MEREHCGNIRLDRKMILKWIIEKLGGRAWPGLISLRIGIGGGVF